jgi:hypothetical protein
VTASRAPLRDLNSAVVKLSLLKLALAAAATLPVWAPVAVAQDQPSADLAVSIGASSKHPRADHVVFFTVTVTNLGPGTATGFVVKLHTHNGLVRPTVAEAPPDHLQTVCPGGSQPCTSRWVPPRCHGGRALLTCTYQSLQLTPPGGPSSSATLVLKARSGTARHEAAVATVIGNSDPNPANNRRTVRLRIRRSST